LTVRLLPCVCVLCCEFDTNGDGTMDFEEFLTMMAALQAQRGDGGAAGAAAAGADSVAGLIKVRQSADRSSLARRTDEVESGVSTVPPTSPPQQQPSGKWVVPLPLSPPNNNRAVVVQLRPTNQQRSSDLYNSAGDHHHRRRTAGYLVVGLGRLGVTRRVCARCSPTTRRDDAAWRRTWCARTSAAASRRA
jgi:hypothetical protein